MAAYLYGSAARGEAAADLDIGLWADGKLDHRTIEALAAELQLEGAPQGPEIDLRVINDCGPRYQVEVIRHGQLLHDREPARRAEREAQIMSRWLDFQPVWARMRERLLARWING